MAVNSSSCRRARAAQWETPGTAFWQNITSLPRLSKARRSMLTGTCLRDPTIRACDGESDGPSHLNIGTLHRLQPYRVARDPGRDFDLGCALAPRPGSGARAGRGGGVHRKLAAVAGLLANVRRRQPGGVATQSIGANQWRLAQYAGFV